MTPPVPPTAPPQPVAPGRVITTTRLEPFRRINIPGSHIFLRPEKVDPRTLRPDLISGDGYSCGCRSTKDYNGKIGEEIGEDIAKKLEKVIPVLGALQRAKEGLARLARNIPFFGKTLSDVLDFDPLAELLKLLGKEVDGFLVASLIHSTPSWVPVLRNAAVARNFLEQEVEGYAVRSHMRHDGIPYSQWHHSYDWSILVAPIGDTAGIVGRGNRLRTRNDGSLEKQFQTDIRRYETHWVPPTGGGIDSTIACEWDLGALAPGRGPFLNFGRLATDFAWPMAGQFVWATGRSVYDCTHTTSDARPGDVANSEREAGLHLNQLHPLKAIATQRWEGFLFKENRQAVPASQFMFFASAARVSAGNFSFGSTPPEGQNVQGGLNKSDYEFVVQLPPGGAGVTSDDPHAVGATEAFLLNTIDIGRRLLVDVSMKQFVGARRFGTISQVQPIVRPIRPPGGRAVAPTHVHVTIPMTQVPDTAQNYGVIISLGWHDPSLALAKQVFKVTITFRELRVFDRKDNAAARWLFTFGANGRWFHREIDLPGNQTEVFTDASITLLLALEDTVFVAAHGFDQDGVGNEYELIEPARDPEEPPPDAPGSAFDEFMDTLLRSRKLRLAKTMDIPTGVDDTGKVETTRVVLPFVGRPAVWEDDIDTKDNDAASETARALFLRMARIVFDSNDVVGFVDQNVFDPRQQFDRPNDRGIDTPNPLSVRALLDEVKLGGTKQCSATGYATTQIGRMGVLALDDAPAAVKLDYQLLYEVKIEAQAPPRDPPPAPPPGPA